jgi:DNA replication protein DnaC
VALNHVCKLAGKCKQAGNEVVCNNLCFAFRKLHGAEGNGGIYGLADIPKTYQGVSASTLPFEKENPLAYKVIQKYTENVVANVEAGKGLYFFGVPNEENPKGTGTGKTTGAVAILNEYIAERTIQHVKKERLIDEVPALFLNVSKFQNLFNAQFRGTIEMKDEASRKYYTTKKRLMNVDLLVMDDIGVRDATESFMNEFYEIIDERAIEGKATIFTSNVPLETLASTLDDRIASRIDGMTAQVPFKGKDNRKGGLF